MGLQKLAGRTEVPNVGHATADKYFVHAVTLNFREQSGIIGIIRCADNGLVDLGEINVDDGGVFCI